MVTATVRWKGWRARKSGPPTAPPAEPPPASDWREGLIADYVAAEDALRAFTDRNFGRMCAICARWTLLAARTNAASAESPESDIGRRHAPPAVTWRLSSWVTNCCNANHALESMSEDSLAGIVATREEGRAWWQKVQRAAAAPCAALTDQGCALKRGRPELCNKYFCEAIRDYLWILGGDRSGESGGASLAARLDSLQARWAKLYATYQDLIGSAADRPQRPGRFAVRRASGWEDFHPFLDAFDREIAAVARPVTAQDLAHRLFKVEGEAGLYDPFFAAEVETIAGMVRTPDAGNEAENKEGAAERSDGAG